MTKAISIDIISANSSHIIISVPYLDIPIEMNLPLFYKRLEEGYFIIRKRSMKQLKKLVELKNS